MKVVLRLLVIVALGLPAFADSITLYGSHAGGLQVSGGTATRMWQHPTGDPAWSAFAGGAVLSSTGAFAFNVTGWTGTSSNVVNNGSRLSAVPAQRLKLISSANNNRLYTNGHGRGNENIRTAVPEPETLGLLGTGLFFIGGLVRRKMKTRELLHSSHDL
jgi:hypothetical protein